MRTSAGVCTPLTNRTCDPEALPPRWLTPYLLLWSGWPDLNRRPLDPQFCPGHFPSDTGRDHWLPIVPSTRDFTRTDTTADDHQLPPFSGFSGAMVLTAVLTEALSEAVRAHYRSGEIVSRQT